MNIQNYQIQNRDIVVDIKKRGYQKRETIKHVLEKFDYSDFVGWNAVFFGKTGSGKTHYMLHVLDQIKDYFPRVFVICPNYEVIQSTYSKIVPRVLIYETLTSSFLEEIYEAQGIYSEKYDLVNNINNLEELLEYIPDPNAIKIYREKKTTWECKLYNSPIEEKKELMEEIKIKKIELLKAMLASNKDYIFENSVISEEQEIILNNLYFDPNTLIIFDDAINELRPIASSKSKEGQPNILHNFFSKGRHKHITHFYCFQDHNIINIIKLNIKIAIFCDKEIATHILTKEQYIDASPDCKKKMGDIIEKVMQNPNGKKSYRVLIKFERDANYYWDRAPKHLEDFRLCSDIVWDYCELIQTERQNNLANAVGRKKKFI